MVQGEPSPVPFDPRVLLPLEELVRPRTPKELRAWVDERAHAIADVPETKRPALLHVRPFKEFYEEVYPLSLFAVRRYGDRVDVLCVPNRDERRDFDAEIYEKSSAVRVEITLARDPQEHLRMEYFIQHGHVSFIGPVTVQGGGKEGRQIGVESEAADHSELRTRHLQWVKAAALGKSGRGRYGRGYELVIAVEDWWFNDERDAAPVDAFLERQVSPLLLSFDIVHVVGWTERLYRSIVPFGR